MVRSRWLVLALVVVAVACDDNAPSGPTLLLRRPLATPTPQVTASPENATITVQGQDQVAYQTQFLPSYAYPTIADISISGAVHFVGDTQFTPDRLPSGDIGPAGIQAGQSCILRATVTFRVGDGLGAPGPCPTTPTGVQTISTTQLIAGQPRFELQPSNSTRNFCGPTTICITWSGSLQLTISPKTPDLTLSLDQPVVDSGSPVTVTATATPDAYSGIAVPLSDFDWQFPDPNVICGSNSATCTFTATRSGTIQVSAIVNGSTSNATVSLTVVPKPDTTHHDSGGPCLAPRLVTRAPVPGSPKGSRPALRRASCGGGGGGSVVSVVCDPATPIRGTDVACTVSVLPAAPFTVLGLEAAMDTVTITYPSLPAPVEAGASLAWSGTAGLTTTVTAEVQVEGQTTALVGHGGFTVTPRVWAPWTVPAPLEKDELSPDHKMTLEPLHYTENFEPKAVWRMGAYVPHEHSFNEPQWAPMTTVASGPNTGVTFFSSWPRLDPATVYINPQLTGAYVGNWYRTLVPGGVDQNNANLPYCGQADVPSLLRATRNHEGTTMLRGSHWGDYNFYASTSHIESVIEALTSHGDVGKVLLGGIADRLDEQLVLTPYAQAGADRDTPEAYTMVFEAAGCSPLRL